MGADYEQIDQLVTREQILAAKDNELDLLVAEYIMGYRWEDGPKYDYDGHCEWERILVPPSLTEDEFKRWSFPPRGKISKSYFISAKWSSDISAAWEVVKELKRKGLLIVMINTPNDFYYFRVFKNGNGWRGCKAKTAEEAICKAALLAVLEESNGIEQ